MRKALIILFLATLSSYTYSQCPISYYVTGGGTVCTGQTPSAIGMSQSQTSTTYKLYRDGNLLDQRTGTGFAFSFGTYTTAGTYSVTATKNGCTLNMQNTVFVAYTNPTEIYITPSITPPGICQGQTITLTASGGYNYSWTANTGGSWTGTSIDVSPSATTIYTLSGTESTCNTAKTASIQVSVTPQVGQVSTPSGTTSRCQGGGTDTYSASASSADSYGWSLSPAGAGSISSSGVVTWSSSFSGTATVTVTAYGCNSSSTSASQNVTVSFTPNAYSVSAASSICAGATTSVVLSGSQSGASYQLYKNNVAIGSAVSGTGSLLTWTGQTQGGPYKVVAYVGSCPTVDMTNQPTIGTTSPGTLTITPSIAPPNICQGTSVTLTAGGGSSYSWSANIGGSWSGSPITVTPGSTAIYTLSGNESVCGTAKTSTIQVNVTPQVGAVSVPAGSASHCQGAGTDTYTASASSATSYAWALSPAGAGSISSSGVVTWSASFSGTATVTVTAYGCNGSTSTASRSVTVYFTPAVYTVNAASSICAGTTTSVILSGSQTGASYQLYKNNVATGSPVSGTGSSLTWTGQTQGTYKVVASVSTCPTVDMTNQPTIGTTTPGNLSITPSTSPPNICQGSSITLTAGGGSNYSWTATSGGPWTGAAITVTPNATTTYTLTGNESVCGTSKTAQLGVNVTPQVGQVTVPSGSLSRCQGSGTNTYTASASSASSYSWSITPAAGTITSGGIVTWNSSYYGTATITVTANGCNNSTSTASVNVIVTGLPTVPSVPTSTGGTSFCQASTATFTTSSANATSYNWSVTGSGNSITSTGVLTFASAFTGSATVSVTATNSCATTGSSSTTVAVLSPVTSGGSTASVLTGKTANYLDKNNFGSTLLSGHSGTVLKWEYTNNPSSDQWIDWGQGGLTSTTSTCCLTFPTDKVKVRAVIQNACGNLPSKETSYTWGDNQNYISVYVPQRQYKTESSFFIGSMNKDSVSISTQYFDGLGRITQTVAKAASPAGKDMVSFNEYDQFDREVKKYLPYVGISDSGFYRSNAKTAQLDFYSVSSPFSDVAKDTQPFAATVFEVSPMNRPLKQGAPGADWQPNSSTYQTPTDHAAAFSFETNSASEVLRWTYTPSTTYPLGLVSANTGSTPIYYNIDQLQKNRTKDEQHNEVIQYTDKEGHVILKRVQAVNSPSAINDTNYASTYYIYDETGNLVTVIPPEAVKLIMEAPANYFTKTDADKDAFLKQWAYRYVYDVRNRMVEKQVPGAETIFMVYDGRDRLVLTQDGNQRNKPGFLKDWTFIKYDFLNRPVQTGKYSTAGGRENVQSTVDAYYVFLNPDQAWFETYIGSGANNVLGYDNKSFPQTSDEPNYFMHYTATYYDVYDSFMAPSGYTYLNESLPGQESDKFARVTGLATGTQIKNLVTGTWMRTVNYYDAKYRVIQTIMDHQKGTLRASMVYDFTGKLLQTKRTYVVNAVETNIKETYTYDHSGRSRTVKHSVNGAADVMITKNDYNELGQLVDKKLHSTDNGSTFKQSVDHRYNIRGWLTKINEPRVSAVAAGDAVVDYFGMELAYNNTIGGLTSSASYNGNISAIQWSKGNGGNVAQQAYSFTYDAMNRMLDASHYDYKASTLEWLVNNKAYKEKIHEYDLNGNIKKLSRRSFGGLLMDSLVYSYSGNQLSYVHDYGNAAEGYINTNTGTDDYSYDFNGNLDKDKNKGVLNKGNITYNYLNLPEQIIKGTEKIKYTYDATGRKLTQQVYNGATLVKFTDYIGELVYEGTSGSGTLKFIQHTEGRVLPDGANWEYQYHLKDHLGNVRVTFTTKAQTTNSYSANLETGLAGSGETSFSNYSSTTFDLVDHTDEAGTTYQNVQWLNGGVNGRVGLGKSISVMPGDEITISAYGKYMNLGSTGNNTSFATALASAFGVSSGSTGEQLKLYNGLNSFALTVPAGDHPLDDESAPKAFVTILFFDKNYNLLDAAWDQMTTVGAQTSSSVKQPPHDLLSITAKAPEAGFAYVFLSNEHPTFVDIYFDDVAVSHTPSPIVTSSDYFPFGLAYNAGEKQGSFEQKYLFNGKELQDELSLNWYDYGARMYMPEIGRWGVIDPMADKYRSWTPYNYCVNNPLRYIDPDGMDYTLSGAQAQSWFRVHQSTTAWKKRKEERKAKKDPEKLTEAAEAGLKKADEADKSKSWCNLGVATAFEQLTGSKELSDVNANTMIGILKDSKNFVEVELKDVQKLANKGEIVIGGLAKSSGSGHVVLAIPGEEVYSGFWQKNVPVVLDTGEGKIWMGKGVSNSWEPKDKDKVTWFRYTGFDTDDHDHDGRNPLKIFSALRALLTIPLRMSNEAGSKAKKVGESFKNSVIPK